MKEDKATFVKALGAALNAHPDDAKAALEAYGI